MSSLFNIAAGGQAGFYDYQIDNSLRFDDGSAPYLTQTFSTGDRDLFTISFWIKRCTLGTGQYILGANDGLNTDGGIIFNTSDNIGFSINGNVYNKYTNAKFRDVSAWYNFVIIYDSNQSTAADRIKIYANGVEQTDYFTQNSGLPPSSYDPPRFNNNKNHTIGRLSGYDQNYLDAYLAEFNFIDGQALDPTSFGETKSGVWIPKDTSGLTFGTNGFRLEFGNSSAIGDDTSGNGNDFTPNNFVAADVVPDSPTLNYATMNKIDGPTFSTAFGNLRVNGSSSSAGSIGSTIFQKTGKWYVEMVAEDMGNGMSVGIKSDTEGTFWKPTRGKSVIYQSDGNKIIDGGSASSYGATYTVGDIISLKINLDDGIIEFLKNNSSQGNASTALTSGVAFGVFFLDTSSVQNARSQFNFGQDSSFRNTVTSGSANASDANGHGDFYYSVPSGYLALNSANLSEPSITPLDDDIPEDYFNTVLYTGVSGDNAVTGVGFQPDWVWLKGRNEADSHVLTDSVRGVGKTIESDTTDAETDTPEDLQSFDSDGFTTGTNDRVGGTGDTMVGWCWLAGGTAVSNTNGSITSSVSANTEAGFSIVSYASSGDAATVGHGLNSVPEMIIAKRRDSSGAWSVYHVAIGNDRRLQLSETSASSDNAVWGDTTPTSTVFTQDVTGSVGATIIAYCFHSVEGYSKFGSYTGNGSSDGTFVYTGFRPAWIIIKPSSHTGHWRIMDTKREINNNGESSQLFANLSNSESTGTSTDKDILSNGFKIKTSTTSMNTSNGTYIYMAFAEMPFKYANAR